MTIGLLLCLFAFAAWIGVLLDRRGFWRADQRLDASTALPAAAPGIVAVIPARNEAPTVGLTVEALLKQAYPGVFKIVVVDDNSTDDTADVARRAARAIPGAEDRVTVLKGAPLPPGWSGKLWAVHQGVQEAVRQVPDARYVLLTDADIEFAPQTLLRLASQAERKNLTLVSLMVRLRCKGFWERLLIPAFIFFFQKLYPFPQVNDPTSGRAAGAGGCMFIRLTALNAIGGIDSVRGALIDDCTLAARLKGKGPVFLGLATRTRSLRAYDRLGEIWSMVARTAYVQLERSPVMLVATVVGMVLLYLIFPVAALLGLITGVWPVAMAGLAGWTGMTAVYAPTLRLYRRPIWWGYTLPIAAFLYTLMTLDSARRHYAGRGGEWKGRSYEGSGATDASHETVRAAAAGTEADQLAAHVEEITRQSGTSFYGAMRILPAERRNGMYALYAFCRIIDDIADEPGEKDRKLEQLAVWRHEIEAIYDGADGADGPVHPVARALVRPTRRFGLVKEDFLAIIEGMEMDAGPQVRIADLDALIYYCDRVACAVGRQSNRIFGVDESLNGPIAHHTGLALQLVNILRDVAVDADIDRLYLPQSLLQANGLNDTTDPKAILNHPAVEKTCLALAERAEREVAEARRYQALADRRAIRPAIIMLAVYRAYLRALRKRGFADLNTPVRVSRAFKVATALRHGLF